MKKILLISSVFLLSCSTKVSKEKIIDLYQNKVILKYADECQKTKLDFLEQRKCDCLKIKIRINPEVIEVSKENLEGYVNNLVEGCS